MGNAYRAIVSAGGAAIGDATAADVLTGKTFSGAVGSGVSGTMPNNGAVTKALTMGESYTIPEGYHNGSGTVTAPSGKLVDNLTAVGVNYQVTAASNTISCQVGDYIVGLAAMNTFSDVFPTFTGATEISRYVDPDQSTGYGTVLLKATSTTVTVNMTGDAGRLSVGILR